MKEIVEKCEYGIDLHTGSAHRFNLPQIRAYLDNPEIENSGAMLSDSGSIDLTAKTEINHTKGIIKSKEGITINAETEGITVKSNIISTNSNLNLTSHDDISSTGTIQAKGDINITTTSGSFHNDSGNVLTNDGTLNIRATSVKNDSTSIQNGYLQGDKLNVTATSRNIENSGVMYSKTGGAISAKNSVITVSYTHLTLPTNREV